MGHYYDEVQDSPLRPEHFSFSILNKTFSVTSGSGTFSKHGLDKATKLLIEQAGLQGQEKVLDLGCGWGAVGLALKSAFPEITMVMSDVNKRALMLSRKNLDAHKVDALTVFSDGFERIADSFDVILTNPPYAAGREVCYRFISDSFVHLNPNGRFLLVARHQKGGAMLEKKILEVFGTVETLVKKSGFRVYQGCKD